MGLSSVHIYILGLGRLYVVDERLENLRRLHTDSSGLGIYPFCFDFRHCNDYTNNDCNRCGVLWVSPKEMVIKHREML